jgi:hypothetical protein
MNLAFVADGALYCVGDSLIPPIFVCDSNGKKFNMYKVVEYSYIYSRELKEEIVVLPGFWCEDSKGVRVKINGGANG